MLKSLKIQNFRGFRCLEINDLGAVNIIGGRNNAGKTSLLEAISLLSSGGNAAKELNPQILRLPSYVPNAARALETFIEQFFHDQDSGSGIKIGSSLESRTGYGTKQKSAALRILIGRRSVSNLFPDINESISENILYNRAINFYFGQGRSEDLDPYHLDKKYFDKGSLWIENNSIRTSLGENAKPLFASMLFKSGDNLQYVQQLADLRMAKKDEVVLNALKIIEPRLKSVSDISLAGDPLIVGDIGLDKLVPLATMGKGMNQIAHIIFQMVSLKNGVALIEEVENGFHYSIQGDVWRAIDEAARQSNMQVFASTHSRECVLAAHKAIKPERLRYHRLEQIDGEIRCRTYSPDILKSAFKFNFEVR